jgi:hypothetical protein
MLRNAAYTTPKFRNLSLAEKFAVSYWEEEYKVHAAEDKLLSKYWDKNRRATPRVDNTLKWSNMRFYDHFIASHSQTSYHFPCERT